MHSTYTEHINAQEKANRVNELHDYKITHRRLTEKLFCNEWLESVLTDKFKRVNR